MPFQDHTVEALWSETGLETAATTASLVLPGALSTATRPLPDFKQRSPVDRKRASCLMNQIELTL